MGPHLKAPSSHRLVWTVVFAALWIMVAALSARALESMDAVAVFLANKLPSQQEINQSYFNFTYRPFDREDLTFDILIPADTWRDTPPTVSPEALEQDTTQLIPLAQQLAPKNEKGNAGIQVAYTRMGLEISLYDFVSVFIEQNRLDVLLRREAVYNNQDVEEILVKSEKDAETYIIRIAFFRHGGRVFIVTCSSLESEYSRYAQQFAVAVVSFAVHQKASHPYAEPMSVYSGAGKLRLRFIYPESWECEAVEGSTPERTGVNVNLVSRDENNQLFTVY